MKNEQQAWHYEILGILHNIFLCIHASSTNENIGINGTGPLIEKLSKLAFTFQVLYIEYEDLRTSALLFIENIGRSERYVHEIQKAPITDMHIFNIMLDLYWIYRSICKTF